MLIHIYNTLTHTQNTQHTHTDTYTHIHNTHLYKHQSQEWVKETHHEIKCLHKQDEVLEPDSPNSPTLLGSYGDGQQSLGDPQQWERSCGY